jgi:hypothetical protein
MNNKVFINMGSAATTEQRLFIDAVLDMLTTVGLSPRIMNENEWSFEQPLKAIKKIIKECDGLVIIAFTRTRIEHGFEIKKDKNIELKNILLPTTWNHIEGSMAYSFDLPLLVIAEEGLKSEGIIDKGYDWAIYWTKLGPEVVKNDSFKGFLNSWKGAVEQFSLNKTQTIGDIDADKLPFSKILKSLTLSQIWKIASA